MKLIERHEPEFKHLVDKEFLPGKLLLELQQCGVLLMPRDEDVKQAGIQLKDRYSEENAIIDIALSLRAFAFRSAKWNKSIPSENVCVKMRENLEYDREFFEDHEPDWRYMMWWPNKCAYVKCTDVSETPNTGLLPGHETHALLNLAIKGYVSEEVNERCFQYSYIEFIDTVKKMLRLTRIIGFT